MTFTNTYRHSDKCLKPSCLRSFGKIGIEVMALNSGDLRLIQKALKEVRTMGPTRVVIGGTWTHHDLDVASVQNQGWFWLWDKQSGTGGMSYIDSFWYRITSHTETFETKHAKTVMAGLWLQRAYTQNKNHSYNSKVFSLMFNLALREKNTDKFADSFMRYSLFRPAAYEHSTHIQCSMPFRRLRMLVVLPKIDSTWRKSWRWCATHHMGNHAWVFMEAHGYIVYSISKLNRS